MSTLREAAKHLIENCPGCSILEGKVEEPIQCPVCEPFKAALGLVENTCGCCKGAGWYQGGSGECAQVQETCAFCGGKGVFKQNPNQLALLIRLWEWGKWQDEDEVECRVTLELENFQEDHPELVKAMLKQALDLVESGSVVSTQTQVQ